MLCNFSRLEKPFKICAERIQWTEFALYRLHNGVQPETRVFTNPINTQVESTFLSNSILKSGTRLKSPKKRKENKMNGDKEYVLRMCKETDVKFIRLWFTDILGFSRICDNLDELEGAIEEGWGLTDPRSGLCAYRRERYDRQTRPETFQILPWRPKRNPWPECLQTFMNPTEPLHGRSPLALKRNLKKAHDLGYTFYVGPELNILLQVAQGKPRSSTMRLFRPHPMDSATDLRRETILTWRPWESAWNTVITRWPKPARDRPALCRRFEHGDNAMTYRLVSRKSP